MKEELNLPPKENDIEENRLDAIIESEGYEEVFTVDELDLSPEEIKEAENLIAGSSRNIRFFVAERPDGLEAKAIIRELEGKFSAHIFSPVGYKGHMYNHDYSPSELKGTLRVAKNNNEKGNPIVEKEDE